MRQKRAKAYRKLMHLYSLSFGFRQPYQVLVDSLICLESISAKIELAKQLANVLQGTVKPMITQCCIHELYLKGRSAQPAVDLAKTFERRKCNHREAIPGDDCLKSVVGETNKHRYVIATQSQPLRQSLRQIPAVPIVHVNRSVMILEPPSERTLQVKEKNEESTLLPADSVPLPSSIAGPSSEATTQTSGAVERPMKKRKGPKGPNPLSVKKKVVKNGQRESKARAKNREENREDSSRDGNGKGKEKAKDGLSVEKAEVGKKRRRENAEMVDEDEDEGGTRATKRRELDESDTKLQDNGDDTGNSTSKGGVLVVARRGRKRNRKRNKGKSVGGDEGDGDGGSSGEE